LLFDLKCEFYMKYDELGIHNQIIDRSSFRLLTAAKKRLRRDDYCCEGNIQERSFPPRGKRAMRMQHIGSARMLLNKTGCNRLKLEEDPVMKKSMVCEMGYA